MRRKRGSRKRWHASASPPVRLCSFGSPPHLLHSTAISVAFVQVPLTAARLCHLLSSPPLPLPSSHPPHASKPQAAPAATFKQQQAT